ncbi:tautomerase family protein [Azoarcus sp. TTM-91]|uniref:tautomerase family protein n=1 Tax=Azoarcus sp. TTM-91 TaxID=2691581 RepID=UPI00145D1A34|nr:tautomerase family protein [Azoarcus sp. TTM-91]NMG36518.1 tautomerase family protein [Azoarcus sp. TTM-91]
MPVSRISLRRGHTAAYLDALSAGLHQALVERFEVPADDRFQLIQQFDPAEMRFDRHYLGGPRSDDWVLIEITAGRPRSADTKRAFYRRLAELLALSPGLAPADLMVVIRHNALEDWSFADGHASMLP